MKKNLKDTQGQYERMTTAPVSSLIMSLAVPSMVTTLISSVYNLADTFFVGQIGTSATAAVGVVFSVPMVLNALGFWVGTGGSNLVSRMLGAKQQKEADATASTAFFLSFFFGLLVAVVGIAAGAPLMRLLGATETNLPYAVAYGRYIFIGAPFSASSLALSQCIRAEGKSRESMIGQVTGGVLNMVLDPLFIFVFDWGISGAAIATALSQIIAWGILLSYYVRKQTQVQIAFRLLYRRPEEYGLLFTTGFPSLCRHGCNMFANVVLNLVAGGWGDAAIAAMSVASRLLYLSNAVSLGLIEGCQPVIGYAHGMKNHKRVKDAFWFTARTAMLSMCAFAVVGILFAPGLIGLFRDDPEVIRIGATALRLICISLPFSAFMSCVSTLFQVVGRTLASSILVFSRQILFYVPALLILPRLLGLIGLQASGPLADLLIFAVALPMVLHYFKRFEETESENT